MLATVVLLPSLQAVDSTLVNWLIVSLTTTDQEAQQKANQQAKQTSNQKSNPTSNQTSNQTANQTATQKNTPSATNPEEKNTTGDNQQQEAVGVDVGWRFFAGVMRSSVANKLLQDKPAGTFLVRKRVIDPSLSTDAEIAISLVDYEDLTKRSKHKNRRRRRGGGGGGKLVVVLTTYIGVDNVYRC
jgi:cytoskeletal protein RodZ